MAEITERSVRAAAEAALWVAAIDVKPIEQREEAVGRWMRRAEEAGLFRHPSLTRGPISVAPPDQAGDA